MMLQALMAPRPAAPAPRAKKNSRNKVSTQHCFANNPPTSSSTQILRSRQETLIVDDAVFTIGSQDLSDCEFSESSFIVEDKRHGRERARSRSSRPLSNFFEGDHHRRLRDFAVKDQERQRPKRCRFPARACARLHQLAGSSTTNFARPPKARRPSWFGWDSSRPDYSPNRGDSSTSSSSEQKAWPRRRYQLLMQATCCRSSATPAPTRETPIRTGSSASLTTTSNCCSEFVGIVDQPQEAASEADGGPPHFLKARGAPAPPGRFTPRSEDVRCAGHCRCGPASARSGWVLADGGHYFGTSTSTSPPQSQSQQALGASDSAPSAVVPADARRSRSTPTPEPPMARTRSFAHVRERRADVNGRRRSAGKPQPGSLTFVEVTRASAATLRRPRVLRLRHLPDRWSAALSGTVTTTPGERRVPSDIPPAISPKSCRTSASTSRRSSPASPSRPASA